MFQVKAPKSGVITYWVIRNTKDDGRIFYAVQHHNGRWKRSHLEAEKFKVFAYAKRAAAYLTKRAVKLNDYTWQGKIQVIKVVIEKKIELEWPLDVLEKMAKEAAPA